MHELLENMGYNQEGSTISASQVRGTTSSGFVSLSFLARSMTMMSLMFSDVLSMPVILDCFSFTFTSCYPMLHTKVSMYSM